MAVPRAWNVGSSARWARDLVHLGWRLLRHSIIAIASVVIVIPIATIVVAPLSMVAAKKSFEHSHKNLPLMK